MSFSDLLEIKLKSNTDKINYMPQQLPLPDSCIGGQGTVP
jgi:hypothetical protein